jgi:hypothetical protein
MGLTDGTKAPIFSARFPTDSMLSQEKRDFLLEHPELVITPASWHFPFTQAQLRKYYDLFCWESICVNEAIQWNTDIIDEFIDELLPIITEENDPGYPFSELSTNRSMPWSVELIDRYIDRWNWDDMVCNHILPREMRLHYRDRLNAIEGYDPFEAEQLEQKWENDISDGLDLWPSWHEVDHTIKAMSEHPELCLVDFEELDDSINWHILSSNEFLPWSEEFISINISKLDWRRLSGNESIPWTEHLIDRYSDFWDWRVLSANKGLPWTEELVARFAPFWHWVNMSLNEALPWSHAFIRKYEAVLSWGTFNDSADGKGIHPQSTVSYNPGIPWTFEMWDEYHYKIEPFFMGMNTAIHWDFETIKHFCKCWGSSALPQFHEMLYVVLPELKEPETLISLMDGILERHQRGDYKREEGED